MRVPEGFKVIVPLDYGLDTLVRIVGHVIKSTKSLGVNAYLTLSTSVITVVLRGIKRSLAIPPLTIVTSKEVETTSLADVAATYELVEHAWIDCKEVPKEVHLLSDKDLKILDEVGLNVIKCNDLEELLTKQCKCGVVSAEGYLNAEQFDSIVLRTNLVADLSSVKNLGSDVVRGELVMYFRNHVVTYGVRPTYFEGVMYHISNLRRLTMLGKPLAFVDSKALVLELPNRSIVFTTRLNLVDDYLLRAVLYTC